MQVFEEPGELEATVLSRLWDMSRADGTVIALGLRLGTLGRVEGTFSANEFAWRIHDGCFEFLDPHGTVTCRFDQLTRTGDDRRVMSGDYLLDPAAQVRHVLIESDSPLTPMSLDDAGARRNLVVMRAGNNALYPKWPVAATRNWDLAISFYGNGTPDWGQEIFIAQKGPKWQPIHAWLSRQPSVLSRYDYVWFPDDDIMTSWDNVNMLFNICRRFELLLAQPALSRESYYMHAITLEQREYLLRYVTFVEGMVPLFSSGALRLCLPVLGEESRFGWGHDWVFPMLMGYPDNKIAMIDACAVTHTRPMGANTDQLVAERQLREVVEKYGATHMDYRVRGCIFRSPVPWVPAR